MKNARNLIRICLVVMALLLALPATLRAQFTFTTNNDGSLNINQYSGSGGVVIPSTTNGLKVTSIGNNAFFCCGITSVTIPNTIASIGNAAFGWNQGLTNVTIPDSVTNIGRMVFDLDIALGGIAVSDANPAYISLNGVLFDKNQITLIECPSSQAGIYTIPNTVRSIGYGAFADCHFLSRITIPINITNMGSYAFFNCSNLKQIYFQGNAPSADSTVFSSDTLTVYYLFGMSGWGPLFAGQQAVLWNPQQQTSDGSFGIRTNKFGFNIIGSSNLVIVVEACTNLANSIWSPVSTNTLNTFVGTNGLSYFSDTQWTNYLNRYYRIRSP